MAPRLLVVDDERPILFAMREYFTSAGYQVDCARAADEATRFLKASAYDGVIADLRLGDVGQADGLDVVRAARACSRMTAIVVLTAHGSPAVVVEAFRNGADRFLHKPIPLHEIAGILSNLRERPQG